MGLKRGRRCLECTRTGLRPGRHGPRGIEQSKNGAFVDAFLEVGVGFDQGQDDAGLGVGHVLNLHLAPTHIGRLGDVGSHWTGVGAAVVTGHPVALGGFAAHACPHQGGGMGDRLTAGGGDLGLDETHILATSEQTGLGGHVFADGGGQIVDLDRSRVPGAGCLTHGGTRDALPAHRRQGSRTTPVQSLARIGILFPEGQGNSRRGFVRARRHRVELYTQGAGIG